MSYRSLEIWQMARQISVEIREISITRSPKFELYETGSQIRRSSKSIRANIVEGYGRRTYKAEFVKHLIYALASCDETIDHLDVLYSTGSFSDEVIFKDLTARLELLGKKLNLFLKSVQVRHRSEK